MIKKIVDYDKEYDVVVAGGGLTGVCAAVAAARQGADVILLEATGALGGIATQGLVPLWTGVHNQQDVVYSGLSKQLMRDSHADFHEFNFEVNTSPIQAELLKRVCDELVMASGVKLLFNTIVAGVEKEDAQLSAVYIANKAGITAVRGKVFVDCTGDADLAAWSGVYYDKGDENGELQPVSLCYAICGIDEKKLGLELEQHPNWIDELIDDPEFSYIKDNYVKMGTEVEKGLRVFNSGHLWGVDNTDPENMTQAMVDGRRLVNQMMKAYKKYMPQAFANATLACTAPLMGVRETRRIRGDYKLTRADYDSRRRFDDEIAFNCFHIDIHPSLAQRARERAGKWNWRKEKKDSWYEKGEFYAIPYRSLLPLGIDNMLVAGRSISSDREINSSLRIMPTCMSMGEAAGIAAALAVKCSGKVRQISVAKVQDIIRENGGFMPRQTEACYACEEKIKLSDTLA